MLQLNRKAAFDEGARNIKLVFFGVVAALAGFYGYTAYRSIAWSPTFYIKNSGSEASVCRIDYSVEGNHEASHRETSAVVRGKRTYNMAGCVVCHGTGGKGGVRNPNYLKEETPPLNTIADRMFLTEREDRDVVVEILESGKSLDEIESLDVPRAPAVVSQYKNIRNVILNGNPAGRRDKKGEQPFDMPAWKETLTVRQIDEIIAYLVSAYPEQTEK